MGVYKSKDGGASWSAMNTGLTDLNVTALAIDPSTPTILYAGTEVGVFKYEASADSGDGGSNGGGSNGGGCFINTAFQESHMVK
jgi:hypothetical protein